MMRNVLLAVAGLAVIGGAGWYLAQPSYEEMELTLRAELTPGGVDVTNDIKWRVLQDNSNVTSPGVRKEPWGDIIPVEGETSVFPVISGEPLTIIPLVENSDFIRSSVTPVIGETEKHTVTFNSAMLALSVLSDSDEQANFTATGDNGIFGTNVVVDGNIVPFLMEPGTYRIDLEQGSARATEEVEVFADLRSILTIDLRQADLSVSLANWGPDLPGGKVELYDWRGSYITETDLTPDGTGTFFDLVYGDYKVVIKNDGIMERDGSLDVTVDRAATTAELAWPYTRVNVDMSGVTLPTDVWSELQIIETGYKGIPYASDLLDDPAQGTLVFAPIENDPADLEFAIALLVGNSYAAMQPIGPAEPGAVIDATLTLGDGYDFCVNLVGEASCVAPAE